MICKVLVYFVTICYLSVRIFNKLGEIGKFCRKNRRKFCLFFSDAVIVYADFLRNMPASRQIRKAARFASTMLAPVGVERK